MVLTHDRSEDESVEDYNARCINLVKQHIKPDCYTFFACSTIIKDEPSGTYDTVIQKFMSKNNLSPSEAQAVTPGHIALYTSEQEFISHSRTSNKTQDEAIENDVKKSFQEQHRVSTYLAVLSKTCFLDKGLDERIQQEAAIRQNPRETYHLGAVDTDSMQRDNCATRIQFIFLMERNRNIMNPIDTLQAVITKASETRSLTLEDHESLAKCYIQTGIERTLKEISKDETSQHSLTQGTENHAPSPIAR